MTVEQRKQRFWWQLAHIAVPVLIVAGLAVGLYGAHLRGLGGIAYGAAAVLAVSAAGWLVPDAVDLWAFAGVCRWGMANRWSLARTAAFGVPLMLTVLAGLWVLRALVPMPLVAFWAVSIGAAWGVQMSLVAARSVWSEMAVTS